MILEDVMKLLFGARRLSAGSIMGQHGQHFHRPAALPDLQPVVIRCRILAAIGLWGFVYRTRFGVMLRATSQIGRMASALGINVGRVYVQAFAIACFMAGLGGAVVVPAQPRCSAWAWMR
jgi:branched-subunit amino acid ABC-type transport system permease component